MFFSKLASASDRYREIEHLLILPEVISNTKEYAVAYVVMECEKNE